MRALTLHQPWASLLVAGKKTFETRSWRTSYRGPLLLHASAWWPRTFLARQAAGLERHVFIEELTQSLGHADLARLPRGAVLATARLVDVIAVDPALRWRLTRRENVFGDWTPGRYAWVIDHIRPLLQAIPWRGQRRLWAPDVVLRARVAQQGVLS